MSCAAYTDLPYPGYKRVNPVLVGIRTLCCEGFARADKTDIL